MSDTWFRNAMWNEAVGQTFYEKLRRARRKAQYLRIQASMLTATCPEAALQLLDQYFAQDDNFDHAMAHVHRAEALLALDRTDEAISSYEAALTREVEFPNLRTRAFLDLPYLIAIREIRKHYERATGLLEEHKGQLMFPVDFFLWHTSHALIALDSQIGTAAKEHAAEALKAASRDHSGFRHHPSVGLVTERYDDLIHRMKACCAA